MPHSFCSIRPFGEQGLEEEERELVVRTRCGGHVSLNLSGRLDCSVLNKMWFLTVLFPFCPGDWVLGIQSSRFPACCACPPGQHKHWTQGQDKSVIQSLHSKPSSACAHPRVLWPLRFTLLVRGGSPTQKSLQWPNSQQPALDRWDGGLLVTETHPPGQGSAHATLGRLGLLSGAAWSRGLGGRPCSNEGGRWPLVPRKDVMGLFAQFC